MKSRFYSGGDGTGFEFNTGSEAASALRERPEEIPGFHESMYRLADTFAGWHDYQGMRDTLNILVDTLIELERGKS
jgi:hypothetical protein